MLLRPDHGLRAPPAPARASVSAAAIPAVSRLPRGALRLPRAASPLRGKTSSALRASAGMPSVAHREVAEEAVARLGDRLLPSAVPADVAEFSNGDGTALGAPDSPIDFMLQSSLLLEEIVHGQLASVVKCVLQVWLDTCAGGTSEMEEGEREIMVRRDPTVRSKSIEVDLTANLPRMFGPDVSGRVIAEIRKAFGVQEA